MNESQNDEFAEGKLKKATRLQEKVFGDCQKIFRCESLSKVLALKCLEKLLTRFLFKT